MVRLGHQHIDIEMAFPLISLLGQYVPCMRMTTLDLPRGGQPHSFGCTFVRFKFWHELTSLLY